MPLSFHDLHLTIWCYICSFLDLFEHVHFRTTCKKAIKATDDDCYTSWNWNWLTTSLIIPNTIVANQALSYFCEQLKKYSLLTAPTAPLNLRLREEGDATSLSIDFWNTLEDEIFKNDIKCVSLDAFTLQSDICSHALYYVCHLNLINCHIDNINHKYIYENLRVLHLENCRLDGYDLTVICEETSCLEELYMINTPHDFSELCNELIYRTTDDKDWRYWSKLHTLVWREDKCMQFICPFDEEDAEDEDDDTMLLAKRNWCLLALEITPAPEMRYCCRNDLKNAFEQLRQVIIPNTNFVFAHSDELKDFKLDDNNPQHFCDYHATTCEYCDDRIEECHCSICEHCHEKGAKCICKRCKYCCLCQIDN